MSAVLTVGMIAACFCSSLACSGEPGAGEMDTEVPVRDAEVTLEVGRLDGPEAYVFGGISGLVFDHEGRIVVADRQAEELRVFDTDGSFLYRLAGRGEGPGEVLAPCCLGRDGSGAVWVRDGGNARYSGFRTGPASFEFVGTRRIRHGAVNLWAPLHFRGDSLIDVGMGQGDGGRVRVRHLLAADGGAGRLADADDPDPHEFGAGRMVEQSTEEGLVRRFFYIPFGPRWLTASGPDGLWSEAASSEYRVRIVRPGGGDIWVEGPSEPGPELSADERARGLEQLERDRRIGGRQIDWGVPERKPPLDALFFDVEGRLWVVRAAAAGEPRLADVRAPDGELLERRSWPAGVRLDLVGWVEGDVALGVRSDDLGVQRVVRLEWDVAPGG